MNKGSEGESPPALKGRGRKKRFGQKEIDTRGPKIMIID